MVYTEFHGKGVHMKKIKEACKLAGISKRTLQYYDDVGILPAERAIGNERLYSRESLNRLVKILIYKKGGLKLEEIKSVIGLPEDAETHFLEEHIRNLNKEKREIDKQIKFTEFIMRKDIPDFDFEADNEEFITLLEQVERLKNSVCDDNGLDTI